MINFQSANTKKYFVHALKSVGLKYFDDANQQVVEFSEVQIEQLLDNPQTTSSDIYKMFEQSLFTEFNADAQSEKYLHKQTAFDRQTLQSILPNLEFSHKIQINDRVRNIRLDPAICDYLLRAITASGIPQENGKLSAPGVGIQANKTIETIIMTLYSGVADQSLNNDDKDEAQAIWDEIRYADFREWLMDDGNEQTFRDEFQTWVINEREHPQREGRDQEQLTKLYNAYHIERLQDRLFAEASACCQNDAMAQSLLDAKIEDETSFRKLSVNANLLKESQAFHKSRCELSNTDPETTPLTVFDVLAAAGNSSAQVIAFFQTRSREQKEQQQQNPKTSEVTKENKIGNVMGKTGREFVKVATGKGVVVDHDVSASKKGKMGPWRGYQKLYERIFRFLTGAYDPVMAVGLTIGMMEKEGYSFDLDKKEKNEGEKSEDKNKDKKDPSQTDYVPMPESYQEIDAATGATILNAAGEFYNKTKARLLADKMRLIDYSTRIQDFEVNPSDPQFAQIEQVRKYLDQRIGTAEKILKTQIPHPNSEKFNDPAYYSWLESQILMEEVNQNNEGVKAFLGKTKVQDANKEMLDALVKFHKAIEATKVDGKQPTPNQLEAKREMAMEMFNLKGKLETGDVTLEDLDNMADRYIQSGASDHLVRELKGAGSIQYDSRDYYRTATNAIDEINQFVQSDLQHNADKVQYDKYMTEQYRGQILDEVNMEQ